MAINLVFVALFFNGVSSVSSVNAQDHGGTTTTVTVAEECNICQVGKYTLSNYTVEYEDEQINCYEIQRDISNIVSHDKEQGYELCREFHELYADICCVAITDEYNATDVPIPARDDDYEWEDDITCQLCDYPSKPLYSQLVDYNGEIITCDELEWEIMYDEEEGSETCDYIQQNYSAYCCGVSNPCWMCTNSGSKRWRNITYNGINTTCVNVAYFIQDDTDECDDTRDQLYEECCYEYPNNPCSLCAYPASQMNSSATVTFNGQTTSCAVVNNELQTFENNSDVCNDTLASLYESCCYTPCDICGEDEYNWNNWNWPFVYYNGDLRTCESIVFLLDGYNIEEEVEEDCDGCDHSHNEDDEQQRDIGIIQEGSDQCDALQTENITDTCCWKGNCNLCGESGSVIYGQMVEYNGTMIGCGRLVDSILYNNEKGSDLCNIVQADYKDLCCGVQNPCWMCPNSSDKWWHPVVYNGINTTCGTVAYFIQGDSDECDDTRDRLNEECCYEYPDYPCYDFCPYPSEMKHTAMVMFEGKSMSCGEVDEALHTIERDSKLCNETIDSLSSSCCYTQCDICHDDYEINRINWSENVTYMNQKMTCGDLYYLPFGDGLGKEDEECEGCDEDYHDENKDEEDWTGIIEEGSAECDALQTEEITDTCCWKGPCSLCGGDRKTIYNQMVSYNGTMMTCDELAWNVLYYSEEKGSETCDEFQQTYANICCAAVDPCWTCPDSAVKRWLNVTYNSITTTCESLAYFIEENSSECDASREQLSEDCCYEYPLNPCFLCPYPSEINYTTLVDFDDKFTTCSRINTELAIFENDTDVCSERRTSLSNSCCFTRCDMCTGEYEYNRNKWDESVIYGGEEFRCDDLYYKYPFRNSDIAEGSDECDAIQTESNIETCCWTGQCSLCDFEEQLSWNEIVEYEGENINCDTLHYKFLSDVEKGSDACIAMKANYTDACCSSSIYSLIRCNEYDCYGTGACLLIDGPDEFTCTVEPEYFTNQTICEDDLGIFCENIDSTLPPSYYTGQPTSYRPDDEKKETESPSTPTPTTFAPAVDIPTKEPTETVLLANRDEIYSGSERYFPDSNVFLVQREDGNLILYRGQPGIDTLFLLWASDYLGETGDYYTRLQGDGNLVTRPGADSSIKPRAKAVWSTRTGGESNEYMFVLSADQKTLHIKQGIPDSPGSILWSAKTRDEQTISPIPMPVDTPTIAPVSTSPTVLLKDRENVLSSDEPQYYPEAGVYIDQKRNGRFTIYRGEPGIGARFKLWQSGHQGKRGNHYTRLQGDGVLLTRPGLPDDDPKHKPVWKSGSSDGGGMDYFLVLSEDQKLLSIRKSEPNGEIIWEESTKA